MFIWVRRENCIRAGAWEGNLYTNSTMVREWGKMYHWCYVPICTNTGKSTPGQIFVTVLSDLKISKNGGWPLGEFPIARSTELFCYEDHFNVYITELKCTFSLISINDVGVLGVWHTKSVCTVCSLLTKHSVARGRYST